MKTQIFNKIKYAFVYLGSCQFLTFQTPCGNLQKLAGVPLKNRFRFAFIVPGKCKYILTLPHPWLSLVILGYLRFQYGHLTLKVG